MHRLKLLSCCAVVVLVGSLAAHSQSRGPSSTVIYEGARLIVGDGGTIENGAFVVRDGRITALGRKGAVNAPAGAAHVDLTGKTVMPAMINVHVHIGYEGYTSWGAENCHGAERADHLEREAFYGIGATNPSAAAR
jgi:imidazolonepropionase-like amidohydrolase